MRPSNGRCQALQTHAKLSHLFQNLLPKHLFIKLALTDSFAQNTIGHYRVCEKEMEMYEKILPKAKELLWKIGDKKKMFANTIYVSKTNNAIIFEDLSVKGYQMKTTKDGFDLIHAKMILSKLAKFHAVCAALNEQQPDIFKNFQFGK